MTIKTQFTPFIYLLSALVSTAPPTKTTIRAITPFAYLLKKTVLLLLLLAADVTPW